jgi:AcrR family transcriptional regulator
VSPGSPDRDRTAAPSDPAPFEADESPAGRILRAARDRLFTTGYQALTMDALAHDLGMSKKTLYAHFASKDELLSAAIDATGADIRRQVGALLDDDGLSYTARLRNVLAFLGARYGRVKPGLLRELERFAPKVYRRLDALRGTNIPLMVGRMLRTGMAEGMVRPEIDPEFAVEFWLQSLNGLMHPGTLERLNLTPRQAFEKGIGLFFWAMLTEAGRADLAEDLAKPSGAPGSDPAGKPG